MRWPLRNPLVLVTGLAAALPVLASTVRAAAKGWLPLGDDATIAVRAYDVLSTHPPLVGQYSASSSLVDAVVQSPGPMLYWLLALPVRISPLAPAVAMGLVNTCAVIGCVALARRRGGVPLMLGVALALTLALRSFDAELLHDVWNPAAALLPFALLLLLTWSLALGEYRLLPVTAAVASFAVQAQLTYVAPVAAVTAVGLAFLVAAGPPIERRWLVGTLAVLAVCWAPPVVEEIAHSPGNMTLIARVATTDTRTFGVESGVHGVVRAVGVPPWWLQRPRDAGQRLTDVGYAPGALAWATAALVLAGLVLALVVGLRRRRRELAAPAALSLALCAALFVVIARAPTENNLFITIGYILWWASFAGMLAWLTLLRSGALLLVRNAPARIYRSAALVPAGAAVVAVAGGLVAAAGEPARLERAYDPTRSLAEQVRRVVPRGETVVLERSSAAVDELAGSSFDLLAGIALELRRAGVPFRTSLIGLGSRYELGDPSRAVVVRLHEEPARPRPADGPVVARAVLRDVPLDGTARQRAPRRVAITMKPPGG